MSPIPVKPEPVKSFGQITSVSEAEGQFGPQVLVNIRPADPNAVNERVLYFSLKAHPNSAWMKFVSSFNRELQKAVQGASDIADAEQMVNTWVKLEETQRSAIINGEYRDFNDRIIMEVYTSDETCAAAWKSHVEALTAGVRKATPPPEEQATPELLPDSIVKALKAAWDSSGKNPDKLWVSVQGWGFTRQQVLAAVQ